MRLRTLVAFAGLALALAFGVGDAEAARRGEGAHVTVSRSASAGRSGAKAVVAARGPSARPATARVASVPASRRGTTTTRQRAVISRAAAPRQVVGTARRAARSRTLVAATGRKGGHAIRTAASRVQMNHREMRAMASNTCLRRDAGGRCTGARLAGFVSSAQAAQPGRSWHSGLPDVEAEQMACPEGTLATLARGHTDTIRCMPL